MNENNFGEYVFGYVEYKDIASTDVKDPFLVEVQRMCNLQGLNSCPDIYNSFPCFFYIRDENWRIISSHKVFPDKVYFCGKTHLWAWPGDTFTEETFRGRGFGKLLVDESTKVLHRKNIGRGMVFSNMTTLGIYTKLDYNLPGYVGRFLMVKSFKPIIEAYVKSQNLKAIIGKLSTFVVYVYKWYCYMIMKRFRKSFSKALYLDVKLINSGQYKVNNRSQICFNNSFEKIAWKIEVASGSGGVKLETFFVFDGNNKHPIGYYIVRLRYQREPIAGIFKEFKLMTLMDYGLFNEEQFKYKIILKEVVQKFFFSDCDVLEVIDNSKLLKNERIKYGFLRGGKGMSFAFSVPNSWDTPLDFQNINFWNLTHFAGDAFSF
jgi:GNAT superfamily N-acetyltransferase